MNYLKSFVKGTDEQSPSGAETVTRLCDRVSSSTLLDDRRDAVRALRSLSKKFRMEVGTQAMGLLLEVLKSDSSDSDITSYALETLYHLVTIDLDDEEDTLLQPEIVTLFVDKFMETADNINLIIDMLEIYDLTVRLASLRLLTSLLRERANAVQMIVLVKPMGISRIMDLLTENREVIRNDALLTLVELTRGNPNIQKIVAFENGFESLFRIISDEGMGEGGVVVEDCLLLLIHLLKGNTSNQQFFKEGSLIQRLTPFFDVDAENTWSAQKVANIQLMLKVVRILVSPSNPSNITMSCQLAMQQCLLLKKLSDLLMATGVPTDILTETINAVSEVIRGCKENQNYFAGVMAPWDPPRPALVVLLMSMVNGQQPFHLRCSVLYCFQCFLHKNPVGQTEIINTLLPSSLEPQDISAGQLLCGGLFAQSDPLSNWLASTALSCALRTNNDAKCQLLRVQLATASGSLPVTLLQQITTVAQQATEVQTRVALLSLLCGWLTSCPVAITQYLGNASAVPFLLSQAADTGNELDSIMHSVSALLLGICIIDNDGSVPQYSKESMIELILARIGIEKFVDVISSVPQHDLYTKALQKPQPVADRPDLLLIDHTFAKLYKNLEDKIIKTVSNLDDVKQEEEQKAAMKAHDSIVGEYKTLIREQDAELATLRIKCKELEERITQSDQLVSDSTSQVQQFKDQYNLLKLTQSPPTDDSLALLTTQIEELTTENREKNICLKTKTETIQELEAKIIDLEVATSNNLPEEQTTENENQVEQIIKENDHGDGSVLSTENFELKEKLENLTKELEELQQENTTLLGENKTLLEVSNSSKTQISEFETSVLKLTVKLKESEISYEGVKKEQDDLLILLSDQDSRLSKYKEKMKSLDIEITDDSDSEDLSSDNDEEP